MNTKVIALIVITLLFSSFLPKISGSQLSDNNKPEVSFTDAYDLQEDVLVTCYTFGMPGEPSKEIEIPQHEAEYLLEKIKELNFEVASNPLSEETQQLQDEIVDLADGYGLLPAGLSKSKVKEYLVHSFTPRHFGAI